MKIIYRRQSYAFILVFMLVVALMTLVFASALFIRGHSTGTNGSFAFAFLMWELLVVENYWLIRRPNLVVDGDRLFWSRSPLLKLVQFRFADVVSMHQVFMGWKVHTGKKSVTIPSDLENIDEVLDRMWGHTLPITAAPGVSPIRFVTGPAKLVFRAGTSKVFYVFCATVFISTFVLILSGFFRLPNPFAFRSLLVGLIFLCEAGQFLAILNEWVACVVIKEGKVTVKPSLLKRSRHTLRNDVRRVVQDEKGCWLVTETSRILLPKGIDNIEALKANLIPVGGPPPLNLQGYPRRWPNES